MLKEEFIYWAKRVYEADLNPATSGNMSVRLPDNTILITSSGSSHGDLKEDEIIKIDTEGNVIEGDKKPSSEKFMHINIYKKRDDIKAIIHSHSPVITAFAVADKKIDEVIMPEFAFHFGSVPIAKYYMPSSFELAENVAEYFKDKNAVLMQNHGIVAGASTLKECFYSLEAIQAYCRTYIYAKMLGQVKCLTKKEIKEIDKLKG